MIVDHLIARKAFSLVSEASANILLMLKSTASLHGDKSQQKSNDQ
jgi:hypothetical protein